MSKSTKIRAEFIPLGYDAIGRVIDSCGNFRKVEAIPYGLGLVELRHEYLSSTIDEVWTIRGYFEEKAESGGAKDKLREDLEGKIGFITEDTEETVSFEEGRNLAVQLYRILD